MKKNILLCLCFLIATLSFTTASAYNLTVKTITNPQHPEWPSPASVSNPTGNYCLYDGTTESCSEGNPITLPFQINIPDKVDRVLFRALTGDAPEQQDAHFVVDSDHGGNCPMLANNKDMTLLIMTTEEIFPGSMYGVSCTQMPNKQSDAYNKAINSLEKLAASTR